MKRLLVVLSLLAALLPGLLAKPSQPVTLQLVLDGFTEAEDGAITYRLTFKCRPWSSSEAQRLAFTLKLPEGFTLEEGFSYWEGLVKGGQVFSRGLVVKGAPGAAGTVLMATRLSFEDSQGFANAAIELSRLAAAKEKPGSGVLTLEEAPAEDSAAGRRRPVARR